MKLIKPDSKEWQQKEGYNKKVYLTPEDLQTPGAQIQAIKIVPGQVAKLHHHKVQTEIFYFDEINGVFLINGEKVNLEPNCVLVVEPGDKHEVTNNSDKDFTYIVFKLNYREDDLFWD